MTLPKLRVLVVPSGDAEARFLVDVIEDHGDAAHVVGSAEEALKELASDTFEVTFVSLALPRGNGLALVHHVRALHPEVDVIVVATANEIQDTVHAHALGVLHSVLHPLTGDAVLVAVDRARERRLLAAERARLAREGASSRRRTATYARCAAFVAETDLSRVAALVLDACAGECEVVEGVVYVPTLDGRFVETARFGGDDRKPSTLEDAEVAAIDPTRLVELRDDGVRLVLLGDAELVGVVDLVARQTDADEALEGLEIVAGLATAAVQAARKVDAIARAGIKDPDTSAYTFSFFAEVVGREIDRAARYARKFALLTVAIDGLEAASSMRAEARTEIVRAVTDALLASVRDSDVVARVEDDEYYVLLPESSLLGALATRRRMASAVRSLGQLARFGVSGSASVRAGVASFPSDGTDLGRLLRTSRRRSDQDARVERCLEVLARSGLWSAVRSFVEQPSVSDPVVRMPRAVLARIGATLASDALTSAVPTILYMAGDTGLEEAVAGALEASSRSHVHAASVATDDVKATRIRLKVDDAHLPGHVLLAMLGDLGGYALFGVAEGEDRVRVYHSSNVDLVDAIVTAMQGAYHLQPEVRE